MGTDIKEHENWFDEYIHFKIKMAGPDNGPLRLKHEHSRKVLRNAEKIIKYENFSARFKRCILLSALYHDIARFDQFMKFGTFCDNISFDHGREGVRLLKKLERLASESRDDRHLVLGAIALHNKFSLPSHLSGEKRIIAQILRDADKLDILRVLDEQLSGGSYNPTVLRGLSQKNDLSGCGVREAVLAGKSASYDDLRSVNDFRLLLGTWFFEMRFRGSQKILSDEGHARRIVEGLPDNAIFGEARNFLLAKFSEWEKQEHGV